MVDKITITCTRYKEPNEIFHETLNSLANQKKIQAKVLVLDQFFDRKTKDLCEELTNKSVIFEYIKIKPIGLSYARNYAIKKSKTDILLYIDSDAIADEYRAHHIQNTFSNKNAGIVGGKIIPKWHKRPILIAKADYVNDMYSMLDLGNEEKVVDKIFGCSCGINIKRLGNEAYYNEELGRKPGTLLGGEETDLTKRAIKKGLDIYYKGKSIMHHQVLPERIQYTWILRRAFWGGYNRSIQGGIPKTTNNKNFNIWNYLSLPIIIPSYILGFTKGKIDKNKV